MKRYVRSSVSSNIDDTMLFNDRYFPRVNLSDKIRYAYYKFKGKEFAYDFQDNLVILLFKDDEEVEALGADAPYRELDSAGLRESYWRRKAIRDEYLTEWSADLDAETSYMVQDFIENELPYYTSE